MEALEEFLYQTLSLKDWKSNIKVEKIFRNIERNKNEFLILLKPEILYPNVSWKVERQIFKRIFSLFGRNDVSVIATAIFDGVYAKKNKIFSRHYSQLYRGATGKTLKYDKRFTKESGLVSAYSFLNNSSDYDAVRLEEEAHLNGSRKVGNGTYIYDFVYDNKNISVINAFHPNQINHFEKNENMFVIFYCQSETSYSELSEKLIGFFKPSEAVEGSLRSYFWKNRERLGLNISTLRNGIHISPSSLEFLKNLSLYFEKIEISDTFCGSELVRFGVQKKFIEKLYENPYSNLYEQYIFDILEGKDIGQMINILKELYEKENFVDK
ncbi:Uncharacterised protein [Enterococcus cecorum]|uniref:hypothetical protein n=1 Tax=Enterococcus cecorum TaxID=44008 RepID=UPI000E0473A4|nr:hypothetical protein [Enterococcus cecorum]STP81987.1 Uncharacterised protein [Enterococcus cecorum]